MSGERWPELLAQAWQAVSGEPLAEPSGFTLHGSPPTAELPATLPVADAAVATVAAALLAAARLGGQQTVALDAAHLAAAVRSERYLRVGGEPLGSGFAPLSRFWRTADGWARTHANYPWHRAALLTALGLPYTADPAAVDPAEVEPVIAALSSDELERRVTGAGGLAVGMRTWAQWSAHPHGQVVAAQPLIAAARLGSADPRRREPGTAGPASGVRVLDLTRVIAGPVGTRFLAALGADVLRLDPPDRPELPIHRYDGLPGKRSALLDAATGDGSARLHELLDSADVLVHGYRPGALARFGLDAGTLAQRHPGLVVVALSAWGSQGPWGGRRGFDSIVQAAVGIAARESPDGERPGALPCQLLDHGTGYLCAAAALDALRVQADSGGTQLRELSLARTAHWLLGEPGAARGAAQQQAQPGPRAADPATEWLVTLDSDAGPVTTVAPPGSLDGAPLRWPARPISYGVSRPSWSR